jgi:hypothetical protein
MKKSYYNSIRERLKELFPGFITDYDDQPELVYPVLYELFLYITENMNDSLIMNNLVEFIQEAFSANDAMTEEAVMLQLMESAMEDERLKSYLSKHLSGNASEAFSMLKDKF